MGKKLRSALGDDIKQGAGGGEGGRAVGRGGEEEAEEGEWGEKEGEEEGEWGEEDYQHKASELQ